MNALTIGQALAYAELVPHLGARDAQSLVPIALLTREGVDPEAMKRSLRALAKRAAGASIVTETEAGRRAKREAAWARDVQMAGGVIVGPPSLTVEGAEG